MNISKSIQNLRNQRKYSQEEVAKKLGITRQTYIKIENNETSVSIDQLQILSKLYGVRIEEFLYEPQNIEKFKQMYFYILSEYKDGIPKTKLAKLLYLADFRHFYETLEPMSGVLYKCAKHGPLADVFLELTDELSENGEIDISYLSGGANLIRSLKYKPDFSLLSEKEKEELAQISKLWKNIKTEVIVNYTHEQKPWMECRDNEIIPYSLILQEDPDHVYTPVAM